MARDQLSMLVLVSIPCSDNSAMIVNPIDNSLKLEIIEALAYIQDLLITSEESKSLHLICLEPFI